MGRTAFSRNASRLSARALTAILGSHLLYLLLGVVPVDALDPDKHVSQYLHTSWRIQDGSVPKGMFSITQTADGFLWFSSFTPEMYRFDGVRFISRTVSVDGRAITPIVGVYGDRLGGLWALGMHDLVHLKGEAVLSHFEFDDLRDFQDIKEDPDGSLWLLKGPLTATHQPLCHVTDRGMKCFGDADGVSVAGANCLLRDPEGGFWIGGRKGLVHWGNGTSQAYPIEALKNNDSYSPVVALARTAEGTLWVGALETPPGLAQLSEAGVRSFVIPGFDGSKVPISAMTVDRDGNLWVGSVGQGLFRIWGSRVEHYGRAEGLSNDNVSHLFEDREGVLWATTPSGIDSFRNPRVTTFSKVEGFGMDAAVGVLASRDGTVWVANGGSLDHIANGNVTSIRQGHGFPGEQATSLLEDSLGNLWVGVDDDLYLFKNGHFRRLRGPDKQPLGMVFGLAEDVEGNIWAACFGSPRKLVRIRDFQVREEFRAPQFPVGHGLVPDPHGGIWMAARTDLRLFRDGTSQKFPLNVSSPVITQIIPQADGSVLVATSDGLLGLRQNKVQRLAKKNGLPCDSVISAVLDKDKHWWLFTDCGVVEFADSELQRWWANPETVVQPRIYDALDGARPSGRPSFNAAALSPDGRMWFATGEVVQLVDPSKLLQKALLPRTYVEMVIVDRREFQASENLRVPPHPRDLQINYTAPTFTVPQKVKFRYRLDGYDRDWHDAGSRRQAFYTDLPPGKYSFRVMASNSDGVWSETASKLDFTVAPAYYQTNWFRLLCTAAFFALLWAAYHLRIRQLQHQFEMTLGARVGERTRIARELHDTLLQSAHGVLLRFQIVSQLLPHHPLEAKEKLDNAIEQTAEFITEARDEVQGLRDSTVETNDLAMAISTLGEELIHSANPRPAFRVAVEGESRNLHPILRDEIYKIAAEALRNAFRHSQAGRVEVEIRYDSPQFRLRVRDDGKGIDPGILSSHGSEGHYGLPGMRERAKLIGGKLAVWSEVDAGTELELCIPASAAYATAPSSSWWARKFATKA
jgi:signal transduction histidine kinase/ligand-binding sensor domain-containing protein